MKVQPHQVYQELKKHPDAIEGSICHVSTSLGTVAEVAGTDIFPDRLLKVYSFTHLIRTVCPD